MKRGLCAKFGLLFMIIHIFTYLQVIRVGAGHVPSGIIKRSSGFRCEAIIPPRASTIKDTRNLRKNFSIKSLFSKINSALKKLKSTEDAELIRIDR